jgi:hypothetical protein
MHIKYKPFLNARGKKRGRRRKRVNDGLQRVNMFGDLADAIIVMLSLLLLLYACSKGGVYP